MSATASGPGRTAAGGGTTMAITSSNLTTSTAILGQDDKGKGYKGRMAGLVATAALGLSLLTGVVLGQVRHETPPAAPPTTPVAQPNPAARAYALNLLLEQNALPELTGSIKVDGLGGPRFLEQNL